MDTDDTPIQTITMGNIIDGSFSQVFTPLSEIPYLVTGQYSDKDYQYTLRTVIDYIQQN
jgi:hypothetical protein